MRENVVHSYENTATHHVVLISLGSVEVLLIYALTDTASPRHSLALLEDKLHNNNNNNSFICNKFGN